MNQFTILAHAGHVHAERGVAEMTIHPVFLAGISVAIVSIIVVIALIQRTPSAGKETVTSKRESDN